MTMRRRETVSHPIEKASEDSLFGGLTAEEFYAAHGVRHEEAWMRNERGMRIYTQWWLPIQRKEEAAENGGGEAAAAAAAVRGIILALHGYTGDSSWTVQLTCIGFAARGFAVYALDHAGHGASDGLRAHIPDIEPLLDDCLQFYDTTIAPLRASESHLPLFLYGESLGGALALLLHLRRPSSSLRPSGIVLSGAMVGVSTKFQPPWPLPLLLRLLAFLLPTAPIVPTRGSIPHRSFRHPWKLRLSLRNPRRVFLRPRPATALLILRLADYLQSHLHQAAAKKGLQAHVWMATYLRSHIIAMTVASSSAAFTEGEGNSDALHIAKSRNGNNSAVHMVTIPFLVVHGELDVICDPEGVIALYEKASSHDKTLKIYDGMWHQLVGEPKESLDVVFTDICSWLEERAPLLTTN